MLNTIKLYSCIKNYRSYTRIFFCLIILCSFLGCDQSSTDVEETPSEKETPSETEIETPEITMQISGGGVPVLHIDFCAETPELKIFKDGLVVKTYITPETNETKLFIWRKGILSPEEYEQLYNEIVQLGFWEWDVEQINAEIDNIQEYYEDSFYMLNIEAENKQKKFSARGIYTYYEDWNIQSLENPCKAFDILVEIEATDGIYIPSQIELIVLSGDYDKYEYLDEDENLATVPWPYDDYPLDGLEYDWKRGSRFSVEGNPVASMVELLNKNMHFSYKERNYLVRYRPIF